MAKNFRDTRLLKLTEEQRIRGKKCCYCGNNVKRATDGSYHHNDWEEWDYCDCEHMQKIHDAREDAQLLGQQKYSADQLVLKLQKLPESIIKARALREVLHTINKSPVSQADVLEALQLEQHNAISNNK